MGAANEQISLNVKFCEISILVEKGNECAKNIIDIAIPLNVSILMFLTI